MNRLLRTEARRCATTATVLRKLLVGVVLDLKMTPSSETLVTRIRLGNIQPGAVKLVLCGHREVHLSYMHPVTSENQFHCTRLSVIQWIPFLMFETLNSCRRKLVCAKIMPNVGKNLSWCALLPNFKKNQERTFVSSQICFVHFPHLRGQLWGVTTSQYHSFLSIF